MQMRHRIGIGLLLLVAALLVTSCAAQPELVEQVVRETVVVEMGRDVAEEAEMSKSSAPAMEAPAGMGSAVATYGDVGERMIIRRTYMRVVVEDTDAMLARLQAVLSQYGGYVSDLNRWLDDEQPWATVTLRIPAENLEAALGIIREGAIVVESETSSGEDVTEEYVDLNARLRNLEATETEMLELLAEVRRNRGSADEILKIYSRITELRSEIESLKGRSQYLERMTALATVTIEIRPRQQPGPVVQPTRWNPLVTLNKAVRALVQVLQIMVDVLIYLVLFLAVPALIVWLIIRSIRRRRQP